MATALRRPAVPQRPLTPPPDAPSLSLEISYPTSDPVPNKSLPFCPTGPANSHDNNNHLDTPPETPPSKESPIKDFSLLQSAQKYPKVSDSPVVYSIHAKDYVAALDELSRIPFPDPQHSFPWLHGLHDENQMQLAFFAARQGFHRDIPRCFDWVTVVKCGGDLSSSCLRGAVSPDDILDLSNHDDVGFLDVDPKQGFGIRNFQIQVAKLARVTDIIIYRDQSEDMDSACELAKLCASAQKRWNHENDFSSDEFAPTYHTFVILETAEEVEHSYPDMIAVNGDGDVLSTALDFAQMERREMCTMTKASEISHNVWVGPTPNKPQSGSAEHGTITFDVLVEANDLSPPPDLSTLNFLRRQKSPCLQVIGFPSSGSILPQVWPKGKQDPLTTMCQWIYEITHNDANVDNHTLNLNMISGGREDIPMRDLAPEGRKVLLHCTDGYTETTLLALAYFMYAEQVSLHEAILRMHKCKNRNFFSYPSDIALLQSLENTLMTARKRKSGRVPLSSLTKAPAWLSRMDGSLPSRILPYLYLGNLTHANNPELLTALDIGQVLSIGEPVNWASATDTNEGHVMYVDCIQDNGVDPLTGEIDRCLEFIARGKSKGTATLVHCRVGVSRSATICIAEVMASMGLSFPRAYCLVRARRLNVIIQPHLLFVYELMKFDERCQQRRGEKPQREMEWTTVCREIAKMNKPYCSK